MKNNKLNMKDFMNIGIFMALNFVLGVIIAMLFGTNPFTFLLIAPIGGFVSGIPMMVFLSKIKKKNVMLVYTAVYALLSLFLGMGYFSSLGVIAAGVVAEIVLRSGNFQSKGKAILTHAIYSLSSVATYIPLYFSTNSFVESRRETFGDTFSDGLLQYSQMWIFIVIIVGTFVCSLLGAMLGAKLFKKHFEQSGVADV